MSRTRHHGAKNKEKLFGDNWQWYQQEPKEWRKIYKHRKRRAEWRRCVNKLFNGYDADNMVYPLDSKPWIYYW